MWRNGITNTVALVDAIRKKHRPKSGNKAMAAFDADLDAALTAWFDHSRAARPDTYEDAEGEWLKFRSNPADAEGGE